MMRDPCGTIKQANTLMQQKRAVDHLMAQPRDVASRQGGHVEEVGFIRVLRAHAAVPQQAPQKQLVRLVDGVERLREGSSTTPNGLCSVHCAGQCDQDLRSSVFTSAVQVRFPQGVFEYARLHAGSEAHAHTAMTWKFSVLGDRVP